VFGTGFWWGPTWWGPGWWDSGWAYAPYYPSTLAIDPRVYVEQQPAGYWYYCQSAGAYYPAVPSCPEPWVPVPPRAP